MSMTKTSRRFQANRISKILVPILLGLLVLALAGVVVVTILAILGIMPG